VTTCYIKHVLRLSDLIFSNCLVVQLKPIFDVLFSVRVKSCISNWFRLNCVKVLIALKLVRKPAIGWRVFWRRLGL
jgi:hypothetical protein